MSETTQFVRACALADVPDDGALGLEIDGLPVAVVRTGGEVFALQDVCSHEEVPLRRARSTTTRWNAGCTGRVSICAPAARRGRPPPSPCPSTR